MTKTLLDKDGRGTRMEEKQEGRTDEEGADEEEEETGRKER